jgi:GT2 family glycosyltransferase
MTDLRHLRGVMASTEPRSSHINPARGPRDLKDAITRAATTELLAFLATAARLAVPRHENPTVSVLLVLFNRAELTFRCIRALLCSSLPIEVVIVDNASTDLSPALLARLDGVTVIRNDSNAGFGAGINAAAARARGTYLLLLNNDAELLPGSLEAMVQCAESQRGVGAVGGKLILPDGRLQEAGAIVWNDGSCMGYGRDAAPSAPEYAFARDVDFCSAALLLTPRSLFHAVGGLDRKYDPAYYEDVDYCVTLCERGYRVIYEPRAVAIHFEFASSGSLQRASEMQTGRRRIFVQKHEAWLQRQPSPDPAHIVAARHRTTGRRILVFDDRVPHGSTGFGFGRAVELLRHLTALGHFVTLYPLSFLSEPWPSVYADIPSDVEVMLDWGPERLREFLDARAGYYGTVIVSRSHNMERLCARLGPPDRWGMHVIYDAEAVTAFREAERRRLTGQSRDESGERALRSEVELVRDAEVVLAVSELERTAFLQGGARRVVILRHSCEVRLTARAFDDRRDILFIGAFDPLSPNADSVLWFAREVLPRLTASLPSPPSFVIAGQNPPEEVVALAGSHIRVVANAQDLMPLYGNARLFVAPTRFAAGIPLKVVHAAAHGVPVVCTSLLARQLGWTSDVELLAADTPEAFAEACTRLYTDPHRWTLVRQQALRRVAADYSPAAFQAALRGALDAIEPEARRESHGTHQDDPQTRQPRLSNA